MRQPVCGFDTAGYRRNGLDCQRKPLKDTDEFTILSAPSAQPDWVQSRRSSDSVWLRCRSFALDLGHVVCSRLSAVGVRRNDRINETRRPWAFEWAFDALSGNRNAPISGEAQFRVLLEAAPHATVIVDENGRVRPRTERRRVERGTTFTVTLPAAESGTRLTRAGTS